MARGRLGEHSARQLYRKVIWTSRFPKGAARLHITLGPNTKLYSLQVSRDLRPSWNFRSSRPSRRPGTRSRPPGPGRIASERLLVDSTPQPGCSGGDVAVLDHERSFSRSLRGAWSSGWYSRIRKFGVEAAKCTFTVVASGPSVVRRYHDVVGPRHGRDLLHLDHAAAQANVRLHDVSTGPGGSFGTHASCSCTRRSRADRDMLGELGASHRRSRVGSAPRARRGCGARISRASRTARRGSKNSRDVDPDVDVRPQGLSARPLHG